MGDFYIVDSVTARTALAAATVVCALGCGSPTTPTTDGRDVNFAFDFSGGTQGWIGGFSDYPAFMESQMGLIADHRPLVAPLDQSRSALFISGRNDSADLFMFFKKRVDGLAAGAAYDVSFGIDIATNVPRGCVGIGAAPGEGVYVKAGASAQEPRAILVGGEYVMNVDKGRQSQGGADASPIGDVANSIPCQPGPDGGLLYRWEMKSLAGRTSVPARVAPDGSAWLFVGTDAAFEGRTSIYYTKVSATFRRVG
jgi:hypothetical protein